MSCANRIEENFMEQKGLYDRANSLFNRVTSEYGTVIQKINSLVALDDYGAQAMTYTGRQDELEGLVGDSKFGTLTGFFVGTGGDVAYMVPEATMKAILSLNFYLTDKKTKEFDLLKMICIAELGEKVAEILRVGKREFGEKKKFRALRDQYGAIRKSSSVQLDCSLQNCPDSQSLKLLNEQFSSFSDGA